MREVSFPSQTCSSEYARTTLYTKIRVLASLRQSTRLPRVTQGILLTVAVFRPWRGSQPAAQDPASDEAMQTHESSEEKVAERRDLSPRTLSGYELSRPALGRLCDLSATRVHYNGLALRSKSPYPHLQGR